MSPGNLGAGMVLKELTSMIPAQDCVAFDVVKMKLTVYMGKFRKDEIK